MGHDEAKAMKKWKPIQEYYEVQSQSQEDHNKQMFQQTRKGAMKMSEYLSTIKKYFDNLHLVGYPMDMRSFISLLVLLMNIYQLCVIRSQYPSWSEIQFELLSFEQRHDRLQALKRLVSINLAQTKKAKTNYSSATTNQNNRGNYNPFSSGGRSRGKGRYSPYSPKNRPTCQICGKMGHTWLYVIIYEKGHSQNTGTNTSNTNPNASALAGPITLMAYPKTIQDHGMS